MPHFSTIFSAKQILVPFSFFLKTFDKKISTNFQFLKENKKKIVNGGNVQLSINNINCRERYNKK